MQNSIVTWVKESLAGNSRGGGRKNSKGEVGMKVLLKTEITI
jgi:hypothetical protein